ncbi:WD40-repeat-containing domain protein [Jimgerdemannia flammicorona]|uniref:WD40-repeat-containing domain protein n=1 Tax=Jimgerdemannia flammicorona TaxID=994334 RepID=A0A433Q2F7_9FUNG|nr:WD40-repeat-containing domain protein [Jimgerdemannia flammicorona]
MSLLNKINAVRIWAKEGGIRSAINAHTHKRFAEVSLSGNLSPELFQFGQVGRYGMTGMASIVAFDPVQSLLAVGTFQGVIHLFGQGITTTLMLKDPVAIKFLSFKTGDSLLVVIDSKNTLTIFDLTTGRPLGSHFLRGVVTCIESCQGTDWLFLGFNDGKVDAFDLSHGRTTEYNIPNLMAEWREVQRKEQEGDHPSSDRPKYRKVDMVVALQFHPKDLNQLLIGYQTGAILFNIKQNLAVRVFEFSSSQERRSHLTVLSFKPDGTHIAAGYDDGLLVFWDIRYEEKPLAARPVYEAEPDRTSTSSRRTSTFSQEPIYRLAWCSPASLDESFLIVAGGSGPPGLHGLHLLNFGKEANYRTPKRQTVLPVPEDISDFIVLPWSSPWYLGTHDPLGVIVLTAGGALRAVNVQPGAPEYQLPSSLDFLNPRTVQAFFFPQIRDHVFQVLAAQPAEDGPSQHPHLPLTGGSALENHVHRVRSLDLLATAHVDGSVRLWDASFVALRGMPWLTVQTRVDVPREGRAEACSVDVCTMTGEMAVGLKSGCVLVYRVRGCETMPRGGNMGVEATEANLRTTGVVVEELDAILKEMKEEVRAVEEMKDAAGSGNPTTTTTTTIMTTDLVVSPEGTMDSINHSPPPISVVTTHPTQPGSGLSTPLRTPVTEEPRRLESNSASPTMERAPAGPLGGPIHGGMVVPRPTVTSLVEKYAAEEGRVLVPRMLVQVLRGAVRVLAIAEVGM